MVDYMCPADPTITHCYHAAKVNELIAERDAEIERLRAALHIIAGDLHTSWQGDIARAALDGQPAPSRWRPIEAAPKDGTQFLTWDSHYGIRVGRCVVRPDHDDWLSYMDAYKGSSKGGIRATHWMPLPPAPGKEAGHE